MAGLDFDLRACPQVLERQVVTMTKLPVTVLLVALLPAGLAAQVTLQLDDLAGTRGLICQGVPGFTGPPFEPVPGELGRSSALADLNGDGFDDLVVAAPLQPTAPGSGVLDEAGHVYVLWGSGAAGLPGSVPDFAFAQLVQGQGVDIVGDPGDRLGTSVAAVGDVDGDGFQDVAIGAPNHTVGGRTAAGGAYLLLGSDDLDTLPKVVLASALASGAAQHALFLQGAREFATAGNAVGGGVDADNDGFSDVLIGAPLDSTNGRLQNGTATVFYGRPGLGAFNVLDLSTQGAGEVTVVHGGADFDFVGFSVAGLGKFDPVLPMTNNNFNLFAGDDVAIGAPGTTVGTDFFAGAVYVLRGIVSGTAATSYTTTDFGNGAFKAGVVYTGEDPGDQLGAWVAPAGDLMAFDGEGYVELLATAPFNDGVGKPDSGSIYVIAGRLVGQNPQGYDVGLLGQGLPNVLGVHIQGAVTAGGQQGVWAVNAGDWNGDALPDIAVGFPNVATVDGGQVYVAAGRARILDGAQVLFALGTVDLSDPFTQWDLMQLLGETTGSYAGCGLSSGDFNDDGAMDLVVGAFAAPSDPSPLDPSLVAHLKTGRAHVIYGPLTRLTSISPAQSWHGGPVVTVTATNVLDGPTGVLLDGVPASVTAVVPGDPGSISFAPGPPATLGALADVTLQTAGGDVTYDDLLQLVPLGILSGPSPSSGFAGSSVSFTGNAFSSVSDTTVTVGGFQAIVAACDGLLGTLDVTLPPGPPGEVPLDVVVTNSNGSVSLPGALQYLPFVVDSVTPSSGPQDSGVFSAGSVPYEGQPTIPVQIEVVSTIGPVPADPLVEFGSDTLGWQVAVVTDVTNDVITCELPTFLLGPQMPVDVRVSFSGDVGILDDGFTYLESDFTELSQYAQAGFGAVPPRALMAGQFTNGGSVLFQVRDMPPQMQLAAVFLGLSLVDPPPTFKGGPFPINLSPVFFVFYLPFPGLSSISISQAMPSNIDPASDGFSLYIHVLTKEKSGPVTDFGFSNVLKMTIDLTP